METISENIKDLIIDSLTGDINEEGNRNLEKWIAESKENENYYTSMRKLWLSGYLRKEDFSMYDPQKAFKEKTRTENRLPKFIRITSYIAAASVLLFVFTYISFRSGKSRVEKAFANIIVEVPFGSTSNIILPDGTKVCLNSGTRIEYSQGFGVTDRNVKLEGEGRFDVGKCDDLPFNVSSATMSVHDIGTVFNICDYESEDKAYVTLEEGVITVENLLKTSSILTVKPDHRVIINKDDGSIKIEDYNAQKAVLWTEGILSFEKESLQNLAKKLERAYSVKIILDSEEIKNLHFYGDFSVKNQTIEDVLNKLSATNKINYRIENEIIHFF